MRRLTALFLIATALAVVLWAGRAPAARAHAVLVRSEPASQAQLRASPAAIELWFSEPLEPRFSSFELFAADGRAILIDGLRVDPGDAQHLSGLTRALRPGFYTVVYQTLSTRDGHEWSGSFTFTVLTGDGSVPAGTAFAPDVGSGNSPSDMAGRWFTFVGLAVIVGGMAPVLAAGAAGPAARDLRRTSMRLYRRLAVAALPLVVAGAILQLESQQRALGGSVTALLTESRFGSYWLWRALAVLALAAALALAALAGRRGRLRAEASLTVLPPLLASGALFTVSMLSHAAAAPGAFWAVLVDFTHLELAALWIGGLLSMAALLVRLRRTRGAANEAPLLPLIARFSVFAAAGVYALATTGLLRAVGELPTAGALTTTGYGRWLLVKLALLTPMLGVALANRALVRRWSGGTRGAAAAARRLRRLLPLEAALGVVLLLSVAVLGQVPTARGGETVGSVGLVIPFNGIVQAEDLSMHLQVTPARVGENELRVHLYHSDGSDPGQIQRVRLTLGGALGLGGGDELDAAPQGEGIFTASAIFASLARTWEVTLDVRRTEFDDARGEFRIPVEGAGAGTADRGIFGSPAPQLSSNVLWALLLVAGGLGTVVWQRRSRNARGIAARAGGVAAIFVALVLAVSAEQHGHGGPLLENPDPGEPVSVERGTALFALNCASCHGSAGRGDGPAAGGLIRPPADLQLHVPLHGDGDLFLFISDGFPGSAMPAWGPVLTERQLWDLVNFLRATFSPAGPGG